MNDTECLKIDDNQLDFVSYFTVAFLTLVAALFFLTLYEFWNYYKRI